MKQLTYKEAEVLYNEKTKIFMKPYNKRISKKDPKPVLNFTASFESTVNAFASSYCRSASKDDVLFYV